MTKRRMGIVVMVCSLVVAGGTGRPAGAADLAGPPPYAGEVVTRRTLTGDWGGPRDDWAKKGVTFDASVTQITQGVVGGGKNGRWEYGGRGDLTGHLDTQKLGRHAAPGRIATYGGSYGGFMAVACIVEDQERVDRGARKERVFGACVDISAW